MAGAAAVAALAAGCLVSARITGEEQLHWRVFLDAAGLVFLWQRLRPQALSDLRETPAGVR
jgi:hypothetical protein